MTDEPAAPDPAAPDPAKPAPEAHSEAEPGADFVTAEVVGAENVSAAVVGAEVVTSPPAPPRVWPALVAPFAAIALATAFQIVVAVVYAGSHVLRGTGTAELQDRLAEEVTSPGLFLLSLAAGQAAFGCVAFAAAWLSPVPMRERFGFRAVRDPLKVYGLTVVGSIVPLAVAIGAALLVAQVIPTDDTFEAVFAKMTPAWGLALVVLVAFAPGFIEEMLFRGYIQQRLLERWSPVRAIGVASCLFALAHIDPSAIALALVMVVWFGVIAWRVRSIGPTIACHASVNGGINIWRLIVKFGELSEATQVVCVLLILLLGLFFFAMACRMLVDYEPPPPDEIPAQVAVVV